MNAYVTAPEDMSIQVKDHSLSSYEFASKVAKHHFCKHCGIYTFHQTLRMPGYYRVNLGCVEDIDTLSLPFEIFDGKAL